MARTRRPVPFCFWRAGPFDHRLHLAYDTHARPTTSQEQFAVRIKSAQHLAILALLCSAPSASAEVKSLTLHGEPFADNTVFGAAGPYERLVGTAKFEVDPTD